MILSDSAGGYAVARRIRDGRRTFSDRGRHGWRMSFVACAMLVL